jgi:ATP-dependent RNA helicase DDX51/DBP6
MTPSSTAKASKKLLRAFSSGSVKILIASDAASRGMDIPDITHVINYDIPPSATSYVHRVGRTARAGKPGEAWTLVTKSEAAWFWRQLAKGDNINRGAKKVTRVEWKERSVEYNRRRTYEAALAELQEAVAGTGG